MLELVSVVESAAACPDTSAAPANLHVTPSLVIASFHHFLSFTLLSATCLFCLQTSIVLVFDVLTLNLESLRGHT